MYLLEDGVNFTGPLFTEAAIKAGIISENKFSFYLQQPSKGDSWLDFGEPNLSHIKPESKVEEENPLNNIETLEQVEQVQ